MRKKVGECLVQVGLITEDDLQRALVEQKRSGERLGAVLMRMNLATERQIANALAYQLGFAYVNLAETPPDPSVVVLIPKDVALNRTCIAIALEKNLLTVAMSDPLLFSLVQDLEFLTGHRIKQVVATRGEIIDAIHAAYPEGRSRSRRVQADAPNDMLAPYVETAALKSPEEEGFEQAAGREKSAETESAPIIDLVELVIKSALKSRASDIHIEPTEGVVVVRQRLDGMLKEVMDLPRWVHEGLVARIKIMAGLDIAEKRLPQDGRILTSTEDGVEFQLQVATFPTAFGEALKIRVRAASDFEVVFSEEFSPGEVKDLLAALADYYRACGGVGFKVTFELEEVRVQEPVGV